MAPKFAKGKGVAKGVGTVEPPESALSGDRTKSAFFFPSTVDVRDLRASFKPLWGVKTGGETLPRRQMLAGRGLLLHSLALVSRLSFVSVFPLFFFLASLLPLLPKPSFNRYGGRGYCCWKYC